MNFSDLERYAYTLPPEALRRRPLTPRDSARLMVYDTALDHVEFDVFRNIAQYIPEQSLFVLNNTRVHPARLWLTKESGGKIEVLILLNEWREKQPIPCIVDRRVSPGQKLFFPDQSALLITAQNENIFMAELESRHTLEDLLNRFALTPLPHYLEGTAQLNEHNLRRRYQSIFGTAGASIAAPTASLHFTPRVLQGLRKRHISQTYLTLNIGLGTFAPLSPENFTERKLHTEYVEVSAASALAVNRARAARHRVVAVGTTTLRTLEGLAQRGMLQRYRGPLDTFIFSPYPFQLTDALITNFHLPRSSLMLLVDAFLEHKQAQRRIQSLYALALAEKMAFYSFGDSLLIL